MLLTHIVEYGYHCPIEPLVFFGRILVQLHLFTFHMTQIQCLGDHKTDEKYTQHSCTMEHGFYIISGSFPLTAVRF